MNPLEQIALAAQSLLHTLKALFRPALWVPWLLLAAFQLAAVMMLWGFAHPALSWFAAPLIAWQAGEDALHYPQIFRALPALYARVDLVVGGIVGAIVTGASTALFAERFSGHPARPGQALGWAWRRAGTLVLVNLPLNLLLLGLSFGIDALLEARGSGGMVRRIAAIGGLGGAMLLQAFFLYANPLVAVSGRGALAALKALPGAAARGIWAAFFLAGLTVLALLPLQRLAGFGETLVRRGTPELVVAMTVGHVLIALVISFVLTGSSTLVYQSGIANRMEQEP